MSDNIVHHDGEITSTVLGLNRVLSCSTDDVQPETFSACSLILADNLTLVEGTRFPTSFVDRIALARLSPSRAILCNGGVNIPGQCNVLTTIGASLSLGSTLRFDQKKMSVMDVSLANLEMDAAALCFIALLQSTSETLVKCVKMTSESYGLTYGDTELTLWQGSSDAPSDVKVVQFDTNKVMVCYSGSLMGVRCNILQASGMTLARGSTLDVSDDPAYLMALTPIDVNEAALCYATGSITSSIYCTMLISEDVSTTISMKDEQEVKSSLSRKAFSSLALAAADVQEVVMCIVQVAPSVKGVCNHLTVTDSGSFLSGPSQDFFTSPEATLDLARLGTQRTAACQKVPGSFSNCTVLYELPQWGGFVASSSSAATNASNATRQIVLPIPVRSKTPTWWIPVVIVSVVVGLFIIALLAFYLLSDKQPTVSEKAQELMKKKRRRKGADDQGDYESVDSNSRSQNAPRPGTHASGSQKVSGKAPGKRAPPSDSAYPTAYNSAPASSGTRQYVMA